MEVTNVPMNETKTELTPRLAIVSALTHRGLVRNFNEDCIGVGGWIRNYSSDRPIEWRLPLTRDFVVLVADGIGGQASGALASQIAVAKIFERLAVLPDLTEELVAEALNATNRELWELFVANAQTRGAGTTIAGLGVRKDHLVLFNVGDSSIYRRSEKFLQLLSTDDRVPAEKLAGLVEGARSTNTILQALGGSIELKPIQPHIVSVPFAVGDMFLLCTDGLTDAVPLDQIEAGLSESSSKTVTNLHDLAMEAGARDNVSIVVVRIE